MTVASVLREAGLSVKEFKNCAEIPIVLYDGKDRKISDDDIHFVEKLFKKNPSALEKFSAFLKTLKEDSISSPINVKIDEISVVVFYRTPHARVFLRESRNPIDYMD